MSHARNAVSPSAGNAVTTTQTAPVLGQTVKKMKFKIQNQKSKLKIIYEKYGYIAQVTSDRTCVVHRTGEHVNGQVLNTHVGEKLPSQDWREVRLMGCPNEIRVEIVQAWRDAV